MAHRILLLFRVDRGDEHIREPPIPKREVADGIYCVGPGHRLGRILGRPLTGGLILGDMAIQKAEVDLGAGNVARLPVQVVPVHHQFGRAHLAQAHPATDDLPQLVGLVEAGTVVEFVVSYPSGAIGVGDGARPFERHHRLVGPFRKAVGPPWRLPLCGRTLEDCSAPPHVVAERSPLPVLSSEREPRIAVLVVTGIQSQRQPQLPLIGDALNGVSTILRLAHRRHNQRRQNPNDRNDHQELNEGKG